MAFLLGGTPPFVAGWAPMAEFDREGLGPFHPNEFEGVGPAAPVVGTAIWVGLTILLAAVAHRMLTREMNRQPVGGKPPPRRRAAGVDED